ncbi:MAG: hypothetical protein WCT11_00990 [Candidatus Magasanikbacteria bacterium]
MSKTKSTPIKKIFWVVGIILVVIIILVIVSVKKYSALAEVVKNARYGSGCDKMVPMQDIAGYPIPIKTNKGETYQMFYFGMYPSYPAQAPGQSPVLLAPSVVAEFQLNGDAICSPLHFDDKMVIKKDYGPRYSVEVDKLSMGSLDSKRNDLFLATEKVAKKYFAGEADSVAKEAATDFFDQFIYLSEPGFQQFYYDLNPDFWQWVEDLTGKKLAEVSVASITKTSKDTIKGEDEIPAEARAFLPSEGLMAVSGGFVSASRRLVVNLNKKTLIFENNPEKNSSVYGPMPQRDKVTLTNDQLQRISTLINDTLADDNNINRPPLPDFAIILFLAHNNSVKMIRWPAGDKASELYDYVWDLTSPAIQTTPTPNENTTNKDEILKGTYNWGTATGSGVEQYKNVVWQAIIASRVAGFPTTVNALEKNTEKCQGFSETALRHEGCMCQTGYWVEITKNSKTIKIDTETKLKNILLPIDSADKAISLVTLTKGDLNSNQNIPTGHTLKINDGFLVQVIDQNSCGCSTHTPTGAIYKVTKSGVVMQIASEVVKATGPEVCVD